MELASNVAWLSVALTLLVCTLICLRRGMVRLPAGSALFLTVLLGLVLLPAISVSDDLLARQQSALPLTAQSWRLAVDGSELATDALLAVALPLAWVVFREFAKRTPQAAARVRVHIPVARWLTRSQRLRPPLSAAL